MDIGTRVSVREEREGARKEWLGAVVVGLPEEVGPGTYRVRLLGSGMVRRVQEADIRPTLARELAAEYDAAHPFVR